MSSKADCQTYPLMWEDGRPPRGATRALEAGTALTLAVALHLTFFHGAPAEKGAVSSGDGGDALVAVTGANGDLAQLVAEWETPPEASTSEITPPPMSPAITPPPRSPAITTPDTAPSVIAPREMPLPRASILPDQAISLPPTPDATVPPPPAEAPPAAQTPVHPDTRPQPRPDRPAPARVQEPRPASTAPIAEQRAAGAGGGQAAGASGTAQAATADAGAVASARAAWASAVRARIVRRLPNQVGRGGGRAMLNITLDPGGRLLGMSLAQSSGDAAFDAAVLRAAQQGDFPAAPPGLSGGSHSFGIPISTR